MLFHGSGTLFKPTRGPIVTLESEIFSPNSTNSSASEAHRSAPFCARSIFSAWQIFAGPSVHCLARSSGRRAAIRSIPSVGRMAADQHRRRETLCLGDEIQHPVHPVRKIDVGMPRRDHTSPACAACVPALAWQPRSSSPIYASASTMMPARALLSLQAHQARPEQLACHLERGTCEKVHGEGGETCGQL